jgi:hypothetical protein
MTSKDWLSVTASNPQRLKEARYQVHSLIQWLARIEKSYGPATGSSAGITLRWCDARKAITTRCLGEDLQLELRLPEMVLQFRESGEAANHPLRVEEHSPAHVEAWLLIELLHRGIDRRRFSKTLPYDVSELMSGDSVEFSPDVYQDELNTLTQWLSRAAAAISSASAQHKGGIDEGIVVRPDDFSLETIPGSQRVLGFKASSAKVEEPFFYIRTDHDIAHADGCNEVILPASQLSNGEGSERLAMLFQAG